MTAPIDFASRFSTAADPADFLQALMGAPGNGAALDDNLSADDEAGEDSAPPETASAPHDNGAADNGKPQPNSGREANGTFAKGNPGGPGNPFNRQVARLRQQLIDSMTPAVFQQAIAALVIKACSGEMAALKLLFQYTLGKPAEAIHPDRVALDEAQLARESKACAKGLSDMAGTPALEFLMRLIREFQYVCTEKWKKHMFDRFDAVNAAKEKAAAQKDARRARQEARRAEAAAVKPDAVNPEADAAGQANPAGPEPPEITATMANGSVGAVATEVATASGEPGASATGVQPAADASSGRSHSRLAQSATYAAAAPSPNRPDGVSAVDRREPDPGNAATQDSDDAKAPIDHPAAAPPGPANRGKTKAPPLANGTDRQAPDGQQSVPGVPRPTRSAKRKTRAA